MKLKIACISENQKKLDQYRELQEKLAQSCLSLFQGRSPLMKFNRSDGNEVILAKLAAVRGITRMPFIVDDVSLQMDGTSYWSLY